MINKYVCALLILLAMSVLSCSDAKERSIKAQLCTAQWFERVEEKIMTGDGDGHGPDIGSAEWRSVVDFKLGLRGNEEVAALSFAKWCDYIDEHFMDPLKNE